MSGRLLRKDLLGGRSRLSDFYNGVRALSRNQIVRVKEALGIPADLLLE
jgi:antitoxin component HigA of HigAB toxin-antitoxin module